MAYREIDRTGNSDMARTLERIRQNTREIFQRLGLPNKVNQTLTKTAVAVAGAATLSQQAGVVTSEALITAAGATYALTLTNANIKAGDQVLASVQLGTSTTGMPALTTVAVTAGQVVITVQNIHATAALNGTLKIAFFVLNNV